MPGKEDYGCLANTDLPSESLRMFTVCLNWVGQRKGGLKGQQTFKVGTSIQLRCKKKYLFCLSTGEKKNVSLLVSL